MSQVVIYCDFDGTITEKDNIIAIMKKFAPNGWETVKDQILSREVSIRKGVGELFSRVPSSLKEDIKRFALENLRIRKGFKEFVTFTRENNIPLYIVSGGIDFFVLPALEEFGPFDAIFCNGSDFSGENIHILWPHSCDSLCENDCGCCKPSVIRKLGHSDSLKIVIGDSVTDFEAAKQADFVLATDFLKEKCEQWEINHQGFETFYDCIDAIKNRIEVKEQTC
ncbi:MAG: 2-hydroxy-3-keto-5-methylthiopentenyl-1-phosphate phosphatase [Bacillota bacterium]|nr:2-hydroxy-3-keto-5-methylthiopentenyl-1-phosphate phosphatase [Bacillota bacterium]MDP4169161.1 2-hydroxy-3-keto-5-methylthiopentenyl-1-phosphate phosphatase [Bacillota bacterium]